MILPIVYSTPPTAIAAVKVSRYLVMQLACQHCDGCATNPVLYISVWLLKLGIAS